MDSMDCELLSLCRPQSSWSGFDPIPPHTPLPRSTTGAQDALADTPEAAYEDLKSELDYEILEMRRVLRVGGHAVWRSAAKRPWYRQRFELAGFKGEWLSRRKRFKADVLVEPIDIRENGKGIDRVNMYASCRLKSDSRREHLLMTSLESRKDRVDKGVLNDHPEAIQEYHEMPCTRI